jgi:hypothetical protein
MWIATVVYDQTPAPEHRRVTEPIDVGQAQIVSMLVSGAGGSGGHTELGFTVEAESRPAARKAALRVAGRLAGRVGLLQPPIDASVSPLPVLTRSAPACL